MSELAAAVKAVKPCRLGAPRVLDKLDDEDRQAIIDQYAAGASVGRIVRALAGAGFHVSHQPVIDLLRDAEVYRGR